MSEEAQLVVVGAGPGGYAAAFLAADLGMEVTLIDPEPNPGGVCLYRGCIPSKALLHVAKLIGEARDAERWGVRFGEPELDPARLRGWKNQVVQRLTSGLGQIARARRIRYLQGRGHLIGSRELEVELVAGGSERLRFGHAILATGSRPVTLPGLPSRSPRVLDSASALQLEDIPGRLLVVGGGYIGLELGSVYASLGSRITLVELMPELLTGVDADLVRPLARRLEGQFERILLETKLVGFEDTGQDVRVLLQGKDGQKREEVFDKVLVAVGRKPNTEGIGLEETSIQVDVAGFVVVDGRLRTGEPHISAIGDLVGQPMLAHKASHEGRTAVEVIAGRSVSFRPRAIPAVVFTDPEIAWCGLTETEARRLKRPIEVARFPWGASGRALTLDRPEGLTKLIVDPGSELVLGMGVVGCGAGELIAEGVLAVEMGAQITDLSLSIHPHPTLSETVMEAAEVFFGQSTHVFRPKRR